ncbi:MAG: methionine adenosyltransferase [Rhodospirillaceae bacterium]
MEIDVETEAGVPTDGHPVEIVERKGLGHPDTICDAIAEAFSRRLCAFYADRFGAVLHHNVDKALLHGGAAAPALGGGRVLAPIALYLCGRATRAAGGIDVPVEDIGIAAARDWLRSNLRALDPDRHVALHCLVRGGSTDLTRLFAQGADRPLANDTSCGVGFAPATRLERAVRAAAARLNDAATRDARPALGEDVKVMGVRRGDRIALTVACAMIDRHLRDAAAYRDACATAAALAAAAAREAADAEVAVAVNAADDIAAGRLYLTVTGTSAESGDDGEVGRGNRANGLITPFRPMTMEAAAGKNPRSHVGKLYSIAAGRIAQAVHDRLGGSGEVCCWLVSRIGSAVDEPAAVHLRVRAPAPPDPAAVRAAAAPAVAAELARLPDLWRVAIAEGLTVY